MARWQSFYLQRMGSNSYPVCESVYTWGVWCKDIPFKVYGAVKEPAKRSWNDAHGDDEYVSASGLWLDSYEMEVEFGCKVMTEPIGTSSSSEETAHVADVRVAVGNFLEYLRASGMMKMYSTHTRIGRQNVRLVSVSDDAHWEPDEGDGQEFLVFKVTFKVNDPKTDITLS